MKANYKIYIMVFAIILFRSSFLNYINNLNKNFLIDDNNLEINILKNQLSTLEKEYHELLDFKNTINIKENYIISNIYLNNYSYDKLLINGSFEEGAEIVNKEGLIGIISKKYSNYSEIIPIYKTNIPVIINNYQGKITSYDNKHNIIVKEVSNYNNINLNDPAYSIYHTYIGKVIDISKNDLDTTITIKPINIENINYVAVIRRY